jgi:hypothetical protein
MFELFPRLWLIGPERCLYFEIGIPLEFGPPFFVFLACDFPSGISPLQEL